MAEAESLETAAEHERILREIESTDTACIGPTLRYPGAGATHGGSSGTGGLGSFGAMALPSRRRVSAGPSLRGAGRATSIHPWRGGSPSGAPTWGSLRDRRRPQPRHPSFGPGQLSSSLRGLPGAGQMVALITSPPRTSPPLPQTRAPFRFADKIEFLPTVCCWEMKLLPPENHNHFSEMSS